MEGWKEGTKRDQPKLGVRSAREAFPRTRRGIRGPCAPSTGVSPGFKARASLPMGEIDEAPSRGGLKLNFETEVPRHGPRPKQWISA